MQEIDRRIASLKLRLAEIDARERSLTALRQQYRHQLRRTIEFAIWSEHPLDTALGAAGEVEGRLADTETNLNHLAAIATRARGELRTLSLTKQVDDAKQRLAAIEREFAAAATSSAQRAALADEATALRRLVDEAAAEAARGLLADRSTAGDRP